MRSRYSAYVLKDSDYLLRTWHPSTRPPILNLALDESVWQGLEILGYEQGAEGDSEGKVEFVAHYKGGQLHEKSRFQKEERSWYYIDGAILPALQSGKIGRNDPCSCGSGRKFKKCCG